MCPAYVQRRQMKAHKTDSVEQHLSNLRQTVIEMDQHLRLTETKHQEHVHALEQRIVHLEQAMASSSSFSSSSGTVSSASCSATTSTLYKPVLPMNDSLERKAIRSTVLPESKSEWVLTGMSIDAQTRFGEWRKGVIVSENASSYLVHFDGLLSEQDEWIPKELEGIRLAPRGSYTPETG